MRLALAIALFALGCGEPPLSSHVQTHSIERWATDCDLSGMFEQQRPAGKHQAWSRDRYASGLIVRFDVQDTLRYPTIRQALSLVADTLYAMILPHPAFDTLAVRVRVMDLGDHIQAQGGGDFDARSGLPINGQVEIRINSNIFDQINAPDHPRYISSMGNWYTLLLHESLHVLGFGTSPKFDKLIAADAVCGRKLDWGKGHWGLNLDFENIPLMGITTIPFFTVLVPETFCALSGIGWELR